MAALTHTFGDFRYGTAQGPGVGHGKLVDPLHGLVERRREADTQLRTSWCAGTDRTPLRIMASQPILGICPIDDEPRESLYFYHRTMDPSEENPSITDK